MTDKLVTGVSKRDEELDILRAFAMLWVILVHCVFWMGLWGWGEISSTIRSFILFEMPLFFFVTGAVLYKSRINKLFYPKRFQRILIPYWIYAAIIVCGNFAAYFLIKGEIINFNIILSWILPLDQYINTLPYATSALWFIPIYLLIVLLFPVVKYIRTWLEKKSQNKKWIVLTPLLIPIIILIILDILGLNTGVIDYVRKTVFYLIWVYLGTFWDDIKQVTKEKRVICIGIITLSILSMVLLGCVGNYTFYMQTHKFPPNIIFLMFSICAMGIIYLLKDTIVNSFKIVMKTPFKGIINEFKVHSLTIFLYQTFAFWILYFLNTYLLGAFDIPDLFLLILYLCITIPCCALLGKIFGRFENIKIF